MPLTELPFGFPGRIFRSPMPFGPYDLHGEVYDQFCEEQIAVIILLASDEECLHRTGWCSTTMQAEDSPVSHALLTNLVLASYGRIAREWQSVSPEVGERPSMNAGDTAMS